MEFNVASNKSNNLLTSLTWSAILYAGPIDLLSSSTFAITCNKCKQLLNCLMHILSCWNVKIANLVFNITRYAGQTYLVHWLDITINSITGFTYTVSIGFNGINSKVRDTWKETYVLGKFVGSFLVWNGYRLMVSVQ